MNRPKMLISFLSVAGIACAVFVPREELAVPLMALCALGALVIFYRNAGAVTGLTAGNPKIKTVRRLTAFGGVYAVAVAGACVTLARMAERGALEPLTARLTARQVETVEKALLAALLAPFMLVTGNAAPKLPMSRYMGLRLPWTVRDEETWTLAHRVLGYLSIPLTVLLLVPVPGRMGFEPYTVWWVGVFLIWVAVPSLASAVFFWRKWK